MSSLERPKPAECCKFVASQLRVLGYPAYADRVEELIAERQAPDGWQLVPKEPTVAMLAAYKGALKEMIEALPKEMRRCKRPIREPFKGIGRWRAMLRAAPKP